MPQSSQKPDRRKARAPAAGEEAPPRAGLPAELPQDEGIYRMHQDLLRALERPVEERRWGMEVARAAPRPRAGQVGGA